MSNFTGTPGPWCIKNWNEIRTQDGWLLATVESFIRGEEESEAESEANMRLIAVAPELLTALTRLANWAVSTQIREAIADTVDVMDYAELVTTAYTVINKATKGE